MARTLRNKYDKYLTYDKLMQAHLLCRKNKTLKKDIIKFELKQEDYIRYIYEKLKNQTYSHGGYTTFYIHEPKLRKIEKSSYMDRVVHRWLVDNFIIDLYMSDDTTIPFGFISIVHDNANLSCPAFKLHIPFDNSLGNIGITLPSIYILVPLKFASLSSSVFSLT